MTLPEATAAGPLAGIRVLDLTSVIMGPWATQILADLGADVICIEAAGGDPVRFLGRGRDPLLCGVALNVLRNKRNVALDLKNPQGHAAFLKIAATCDVLITNLRPSSRARLGVTYEDVRAVRPDIVYCHAQGWAADSGRADDPAYDDVIQAGSGMGALFNMQYGRPSIAPVAMADQICSITIVYSVLAALLHRQRTGEGQRVEIPMMDTMASFVLVMHGKDAIFEPPLGPAGYERIASPLRAPMATSDGYLQVVLYTRENWIEFLTSAGVADAREDQRLQSPVTRNEHYSDLYKQMAQILRTRTTQEWIDWCKEHRVAYSPVNSLDDLISEIPVAEHPQGGRYRQLPCPVRFSATPATIRSEAPLPGAHNAEILAEAGYSPDDIAALREAGAIVDESKLNPR